MPKGVVLRLSSVLNPHVEERNTTYHKAVPVLVCVCCTLYKLAHGASLVQCSESFAIGVTTVYKILQDVVRAINIRFRS